MKVFIDEEYGYRYWTWHFPGTMDELIAEWKAGQTPRGVGYVYSKEFLGTIEQAGTPESPEEHDETNEEAIVENLGKEWDKFFSAHDARCFIHEEDDSWLYTPIGNFSWEAKVDHSFVSNDIMKKVLEKK